MSKINRVLTKLNLSLIITLLVCAAISLLSVPIALYDDYVISQGRECYRSNRTKNLDMVREHLKVPLTPDTVNATDDATAIVCRGHLYRSTYGDSDFGAIFYSDKTIWDNSPRPSVPIALAGFFLGFAVFLNLFERWLRWVVKD